MPVELQQQGLVSSLYEFVWQLNEGLNGPEISFTPILDKPLPESMQQGLLQITKELVNNALKHASATVIDVELYQRDQTICLTVSDDGCGYNPQQVRRKSSGIGLRNVRSVVNQLKGKLNIDAKPSGGMMHQVTISK